MANNLQPAQTHLSPSPLSPFDQNAQRDMDKDVVEKGGDTLDVVDVDANDSAEAEVVYIDEATSRRIGRRLDRLLLPLMCGTYILQALDKGSISYGAIWGMRTDLKLTANEYSWLGSLFYLGYLFLEYPMGYVAQHWHTGRVVGTVCFWWGLTTMSTAICHNFAGVAAQRFILGCLESALTPAFVLITSVFYKKSEQANRVLIWWSMNGVSGAFGGVISFVAGYINYNGIPSWKWIFIINGGVTVMWSFLLFFWLPSSPQNARFLSDEDKHAAVHRLRDNKTGTRNAVIKRYQIFEALDPRKDPQGWLLFLAAFFNEFPNGGYANFKPLIVRSLGFSQLQSSLLGIATGGAQTLWMLIAGIVTQKYTNSRIYAAMGALVPSFIGFLLQIAMPQDSTKLVQGVKMFGVCLMPAYAATCAIVIQLPAQNAGGFTKRITMTSFAFLGYSLGNICGPQAFYPAQTPDYLTGFVASMVCFGCQWICLSTLRIYYVRQNRRRDKEYGPAVSEAGDAVTDLTDKENKNFRYVY